MGERNKSDGSCTSIRIRIRKHGRLKQGGHMPPQHIRHFTRHSLQICHLSGEEESKQIIAEKRHTSS